MLRLTTQFHKPSEYCTSLPLGARPALVQAWGLEVAFDPVVHALRLAGTLGPAPEDPDFFSGLVSDVGQDFQEAAWVPADATFVLVAN